MSRQPIVAVQIEVNGEMIPASAASWYQVAPCGCSGGVHVVQMPYTGEVLLDGEAAFATGLSAAERAKDKAQGFTYELGLRSEVTERMTACPHTPKWGIEPRPEMPGHLWAASRQSRTLHLVTEQMVTTESGNKVSLADVVAVCGATSWSWSNLWHRVSGKVECKRCIKAATR